MPDSIEHSRDHPKERDVGGYAEDGCENLVEGGGHTSISSVGDFTLQEKDDKYNTDMQ